MSRAGQEAARMRHDNGQNNETQSPLISVGSQTGKIWAEPIEPNRKQLIISVCSAHQSAPLPPPPPPPPHPTRKPRIRGWELGPRNQTAQFHLHPMA